MVRETKSFHLRIISPRINIKKNQDIPEDYYVINYVIGKENVNPVF